MYDNLALKLHEIIVFLGIFLASHKIKQDIILSHRVSSLVKKLITRKLNWVKSDFRYLNLVRFQQISKVQKLSKTLKLLDNLESLGRAGRDAVRPYYVVEPILISHLLHRTDP